MVSIHAPREGCDAATTANTASKATFQFTHPGRGATVEVAVVLIFDLFQFTHPGRGATRPRQRVGRDRAVSIHAPREGCDGKVDAELWREGRFNSRTPGGVRRDLGNRDYQAYYVSIHAPREGCDGSSRTPRVMQISFNSRTPGGVRPRL